MSQEISQPSVKIGSIAEGQSYVAQGFLTPSELEQLARDLFLQGGVSREEYERFVLSKPSKSAATLRNNITALAQRITTSLGLKK